MQTCEQKKNGGTTCTEPAAHRFTWPGRAERETEYLVEAALEWRKHFCHDGRHWQDGPLASAVDRYIGATRSERAKERKP